MGRRLVVGWLVALLAGGWTGAALARGGEPCPADPPMAGYAERIAAAACAEHRLWYRPFIDVHGRLASMTVAEAERARLQDGATPAWRRVVDYWKGSGLLEQMAGRPGASECRLPRDDAWPSAACRAFVVDTPWSAAFVSFVLLRAGVPGFGPSASHVDFVRAAARADGGSAYRLADPEQEPPAAGDLLCFARTATPLGHAGLKALLARDGTGLPMHCDIVVAASPGGDSRLHLVGGNVLQGVTGRMLALNRNGLLWNLPRRSAVSAACSPADEAGCDLNRQDWVALLKLRPLPAPTSPMPALPQAAPACCRVCTLPMPPGMQRCPVPATEGAAP